MEKDILCVRLVELRKEKKMSQQQVANEINVSRSSYSQYELGTKQPNIQTLKLIAELHHCSIDYLVGRYEK
ncbi:MAG: helix-turn-helix transcriptional regulator [Oscillospiraceae bacterium]